MSIDSSRGVSEESSEDEDSRNQNIANKLKTNRSVEHITKQNVSTYIFINLLVSLVSFLSNMLLQYQKEIERLQASVQILKLKLGQAKQQLDSEPDSPEIIDNEPDNMKNIIARYV